MDIATQYETDKPYISWVRDHITPTSSLEMQKFRVYIHFRDQVKKARVTESNHMQVPMPVVMSTQTGGRRPEGRNVPKTMKTRPNAPMESDMEVDAWSMVSPTHQKNMVQRWEHVINEMKVNRGVAEAQMRAHLEHMDKKTLAKFMMNMGQ